MFTLRLAIALPLLVLACTPDKSDSVTDTSTDTTTDPSTTGSTTDQPTSTTGSTTDQPTSTTGSTTDQPTTEPGTTGEPACSPGPAAGDLDCAPPGGTVTSWQFLVDDVAVEAFDEFCTIDEVTDDGSTQTFALTCAGSSAALALTTTSPHVALALDTTDTIQIEFATEPDGEVFASSFMLRDDTDALLAAGLDRWVLLPLTLDLLNIGLRTTDCDGFLDEFGCFVIQRAAVEVALGDQSVAVLGGNAGVVGEFQILVNDSTSNVCLFDDQCGFNYSPFSTSALFLRPGA